MKKEIKLNEKFFPDNIFREVLAEELGLKENISENSARVIDFRAKTKIKNILKKERLLNE